MNRQMLANLPDQAVLEILYHLTCLSSMKGQPATELRQSLESEMGLVLREDKLNIDQATNLYEALREDGELERQMGEEIFNSLCQKVKDFRDRLKIA
jgi:hypothetical protein